MGTDPHLGRPLKPAVTRCRAQGVAASRQPAEGSLEKAALGADDGKSEGPHQ